MDQTVLAPSSGCAPAHDVRASLTFIVLQETKSYFESTALTGGVPRVHYETEVHRVDVRDMRRIANLLSLDRQGFVLVRHVTAVDDLFDAAAVATVYDRELQALLTEVTGADRVAVFDHTRRSDSPRGAANPDGFRGPARTGCTWTTPSIQGPKRAGDALGHDEVERVLSSGGRIVQTNVWRPIRGPVLRTPIALADAASVVPDELIATDQVFPNQVGEIYTLAYAPGQRRYWVPRMQRDEVLLVKSWDSLDDGCARFTPHGAFQLEDQDPAAPPRESIEVRTYLVFEG